MMENGCLSDLTHIHNLTKDPSIFETMRVVKELIDVFPTDLPSVPPNRDINFLIDMESGTKPISISPYRMAPVELKELKAQLEDLLHKVFIRPSLSPWSALVLFVKKKG
ncbi:hypothetical protein MTR67_052724 [Solanum verrucosum]|uniref:Uncharacterized protein n=1 Tax=Solanum verrucosum TaxID=315347 RepID=A0AAF0V8X8_SOLVR|nr:hypothetical protein MTR67_052724 [Solanum verrucosum]